MEGKKGVGKSTLINCLLKEYKAKEGEYSVTTLCTGTYNSKNIPFLSLIDTRGYELNEKYNPDEIKKEVLKTIQLRRKFIIIISNVFYFVLTVKMILTNVKKNH